MSKERQPEGHPDKTEVNENNEDGGEPMKEFKALTRRLLTISNRQLREEQERYSKDESSNHRRKKT